MAPPLTFKRSIAMPRVSAQYSTCTAKASLSSHRSMSFTFSPNRSSTLGTAKMGPMPISSGSQPATAKPRKRPSGCRPLRCATASSISTQAPAPSLNWLALPAAIKPPGSAGRMLQMPSNVVPGRMPSSSATVTSLLRRPSTGSTTPAVTVMGAISSLKRPACSAALARCWLAAP